MIQDQGEKYKEIDLVEIAKKLWVQRRLVIKNCFYAAIAGVIIAFSIPKEYETEVTLAPEESGAGGALGGNLSSLASLAGINLGGMSSEDAFAPELYPDILASTPFLVDLFNVPVLTKKGDVSTYLYDYMDNHTRSPWFSYLISAPGKMLGWVVKLIKNEKEEENSTKANYFDLTRDQEKMVKTLSKCIKGSVDKKTGVITLSVRMQDPLIAAALADTVKNRLQNFITDYRTSKARHDLEFSQKLYEEAKEDYLKAQAIYATFADRNLDVIQQRYKVEEERLIKEVNLAYTIYSQVASQLQLARAKVQQQTPVYTVIQPAKMSIKAASPKKVMLLIAFVFLGFLGTGMWILFKDKLLIHKKEDR